MADNILANMPILNVKIVFAAHFTVLSLSLLGIWYSTGYLFYNLILMLILLMCIFKQNSEETLQVALFVNGLSIILDIIVLSIYFPNNAGSREGFFGAMAIVHLLLRPCSCLVLARILQEHNNNSLGTTSNLFGVPRNSSYEDMDKNAGPSPSNQGGYTFTGAQQI